MRTVAILLRFQESTTHSRRFYKPNDHDHHVLHEHGGFLFARSTADYPRQELPVVMWRGLIPTRAISKAIFQRRVDDSQADFLRGSAASALVVGLHYRRLVFAG